MTVDDMIKCLLKGGYELCMADKAEISNKLRAAIDLAEAAKQVAHINCKSFDDTKRQLKVHFAVEAFEKAGSGER